MVVMLNPTDLIAHGIVMTVRGLSASPRHESQFDQGCS